MAQHDYDLANGTGASFRADANAALAAILTLNSGASEPSARQAYMLWADTTAGQLKQRNAANNAWVVVGSLGVANLGLLPNTGGSQANTSGSASAPSYSFNGDSGTGIYRPGAGIVAITIGGLERFRITAQGYLKAASNGVYAFPTGNLHELASTNATAPVLRIYSPSATYAGTAVQIIANRNTTNSSFGVLQYFNEATSQTRFSVDDSGKVLALGSYNATTANAANVNIDTFGNLVRSTSSRIYKTDIEPVADKFVDVVLSLNPVRYRSLAESDNAGWSFYGLIAEEVAEVDPRLVHWGYRDEDYETVKVEEQRFNEEAEEIETLEVDRRQLCQNATLKPEGVQYERVGVLTLALVQRHEARIAELEARIEALESK